MLSFIFNNIMLPDSNANERESHSFLSFSIKPKKELAKKTKVENYADIFFDYNEPVRTNTMLNTIYDIPPIIESVQLDGSLICNTTNTSIHAGLNRIICEMDTVILQASTPLQGDGRWRIISGQGRIQDKEKANSLLSSLGYGDNLLEWSIPANNCGDSSRTRVLITRLIKPTTPLITQVGTDTLVCSANANSYEWYRNGERLDKQTKSILAERVGNYTVIVKDEKGCLSDISPAFAYLLTVVEPTFAFQLKIYPNPTNGLFTLILPAGIGQGVRLLVVDALGKTILSRTIRSSQEEVDLTEAASGLYLLKLYTSKGVIVRRIFKK